MSRIVHQLHTGQEKVFFVAGRDESTVEHFSGLEDLVSLLIPVPSRGGIRVMGVCYLVKILVQDKVQ